MNGLAKLECLVTSAYTTDTMTERELRWVKTIKSLNSEHLLKDNEERKTQYCFGHESYERGTTILSSHHSRMTGNIPQCLCVRNPGPGLTAIIDLC